MPDPTDTPIVVTTAQGLTDAIQAALRYMVVIVGFFSGLGAFLGKQDAVGAVTYVQTNLGGVVAAAFGLVGLGTALYGIYKTYKRGAQLSNAAADPAVPDRVLSIKN